MSWSVNGKVTAANKQEEVQALTPTGGMGEGANKQLAAVKESALSLLEILGGDQFNVSLSGHSQADMPGSAPDAIYISISAIS
jgi:hypothetical protein